MLSRAEFHNALRKIVLLYNSFLYVESDLLSPGLWKVLAKYASVYQNVLPFRVLLHERKIYLARESTLKLVIIKLSSILLTTYTGITLILLIKKLGFIHEEAMHDWLSTKRTFAMFFITFMFSTIIPTSLMIALQAEPLCQVINQINQFSARVRGL